MKEPKWLTERMILGIHDEAIAEFGGSGGVRDQNLLNSALHRPQQRFAYEADADVFRLAASLCIGIAKNHPFADGNKRTALLSARAFLFLNGQVFEPEESAEVETMVGVATSAIDEAQLAAWFQEFSSPRKRSR